MKTIQSVDVSSPTYIHNIYSESRVVEHDLPALKTKSQLNLIVTNKDGTSNYLAINIYLDTFCAWQVDGNYHSVTNTYNQRIIYVLKETPYFFNPHEIYKEKIKAITQQTNANYIKQKYNVVFASQAIQLKDRVGG